MKIPHDRFCVLPWVSLETSPIGTVRPCCLAEEEITDDAGNKFELTQANLSDVQSSAYMQNLRQQFLDGQQPQTCRKCWNEERAGRTSKRMHTLERLKHMGISDEWTADAKPLMFLDLKLGNICNLKCRICGSWSSSQAAVEEIDFISSVYEKKNSFHYTMLKKGAWPRRNQKFWNEIDGILDQIRYIEFTGGEPFMIAEHFDLLQGIVDRGIAHQVEIHYNTNATIFPKRGPEIWRHFKTVEIAVSIDDIGSRFEYQRSGAVWAEVKNNIDLFRALRTHFPNLQLQCCSTVNAFNVLYLEELALWHSLQDFDFVYWNMLHEPYYLSIATLPESAKSAVAARLKAADVDATVRAEFDRIVDFMMRGVSLDGDMLRMTINSLDTRRLQRITEIQPELAELIGITQ